MSISKFLLLLIANFFAQALREQSWSCFNFVVGCEWGNGGMFARYVRLVDSAALLLDPSHRHNIGRSCQIPSARWGLCISKQPNETIDKGVLLPVTPPSMLIFRTIVFELGVWGGVWGTILAFVPGTYPYLYRWKSCWVFKGARELSASTQV